MSKRNMEKIRVEQSTLAGKELKYTVMRIARVIGWPIWLLGIATFTVSLISLLMWANESGEPMKFISLGLVGLVVSFITLCAAHAIFDPYMFESNMPNKDGRTRCMECGEGIQSHGVFFRCEKCGTFCPIPGSAIFARIIGSWVTWLHIILVGCGVLFAAL